MTNQSHTPGPWTIDERIPAGTYSQPARPNGGYITVCGPQASARMLVRANGDNRQACREAAATIANACNSHDALVAALRELDSIICQPHPNWEALGEATERARKVLANV
jgi:hypothetical protein